MRKKILERLQAKKAGSLKKLSQKGLELLLTKLEAKIEKEEDIDSSIEDLDNSIIPFDDFVELIQKESDRKSRSVRTALEKEFDFVRKKNTSEDEEDDDDDDEPAGPKKKSGTKTSDIIATEIAKALAPFQSMVKGMSLNTQREALKPKLKAKGIPESWVSDIQIGDDFNEEDAITSLETKWNETKQLAINQGIGDGTVFKGNGGSSTSATDAIKEYGKSTSSTEGCNIIKDI